VDIVSAFRKVSTKPDQAQLATLEINPTSLGDAPSITNATTPSITVVANWPGLLKR